MKNFEPKQVHVENLLLDPNNPRLKCDCSEQEVVPDADVQMLQSQLLSKFRLGRSNQETEDEFFDITSLGNSMRSIGYVPIDRLVVRALAHHESLYVVVEGNRRLATIKRLRELHEKKDEDWSCESGEVRKSLDELEVMVLETKEVPEDEWRHQVNVILGIRHHGSLLEWEPLAEAYNLYREYRRLHPDGQRFTLHNRTVKRVSALLAVAPSRVKNALKTYVAYLQLLDNDRTAVKDRHYSLIEALITNGKIMSAYLKQDPSTFELDDASIGKVFRLCQFADRDGMDEDKKVLRRPQSVSKLAKVVDAYISHATEAVRNWAASLIAGMEQWEDGMTAEKAADLITAFINRQQWAQTVLKYLEEREEKLPFDKYASVGNDRQRKDELWRRVRQLQVLIQHAQM